MLPADAGSVAIAPEAEQVMGLVAVEPTDRVVKPRAWVDVATAWQRIVDMLGPGFFFERTEDQLLILRGTRNRLMTVSPTDNSRRIEFQHGLHVAVVGPFR